MRTADVAVVSGGASGLGLATTEALMEQGLTVAVLDLPEALAQTAAPAHLYAADVTDADQVTAAVRAAERLGEVRICVNCAGVASSARIVRDGVPLPLDDFRRVIDVNLVGTFNVSRIAAASMAALDPIDGERGVIISTSSIAAYDGQVGQIAYAASKAGIAGMVLPMARDLARSQIRCVAIAPGIFDTSLLARVPDAAQKRLLEAVPHPSRLGRPREFAALVLHAISNPMLNGEVIRLDGALRLAPS